MECLPGWRCWNRDCGRNPSKTLVFMNVRRYKKSLKPFWIYYQIINDEAGRQLPFLGFYDPTKIRHSCKVYRGVRNVDPQSRRKKHRLEVGNLLPRSDINRWVNCINTDEHFANDGIHRPHCFNFSIFSSKIRYRILTNPISKRDVIDPRI